MAIYTHLNLLQSVEATIDEHVEDIFSHSLDALDTVDNRKTLRRALHAQLGLADFPLEISCPYSDSFCAHAMSSFSLAFKETFGMSPRHSTQYNNQWDRLSDAEKLEVYVAFLKGGGGVIETALEARRRAQIEGLRSDIVDYFTNLKDEEELRDWYHEIRPCDGGTK